MSSENLDVICIYRSENGLVQDLFQQLCPILTPLKPTFICGDFNLCFLKNKNNTFTQYLIKKEFSQIVKYSTHEKGGLLDHIYIKNISQNYHIHHHAVYYSDHEGICVTLGVNKEEIEQLKKLRKTIFF